MEENHIREFDSRRCVEALVGTVDAALNGVLGNLRDEICQRGSPGMDRAQVARACGDLRLQLQRQGGKRIKRFEQLMLDYLLRAPECHFGDSIATTPAIFMDHRNISEAAEPSFRSWGDCSNITALGATKRAESLELERDFDEEISEASSELASMVRKARILQTQAKQLASQLQLVRDIHATIYNDSSNCGGMKQTACELHDVVAKLSKFQTEKETNGSCPSPSKRSRRCEDEHARIAGAVTSRKINW